MIQRILQFMLSALPDVLRSRLGRSPAATTAVDLLVLGFPIQVSDLAFATVYAWCPELAGIWAMGDTRELAIATVREQLGDALECHKPEGVDCFDWCANWNGEHLPCGLRSGGPIRRAQPARAGGQASR